MEAEAESLLLVTTLQWEHMASGGGARAHSYTLLQGIVYLSGTLNDDICSVFQGTLKRFRARPRPSKSWMTGRAGAGDLNPEAGPARTTPPLLQIVTWR